jgi:hypothetical protein
MLQFSAKRPHAFVCGCSTIIRKWPILYGANINWIENKHAPIHNRVLINTETYSFAYYLSFLALK